MSAADSSPTTILIVDDDPVLRARLARAFAARGLEVAQAASATEALLAAALEPPELAVVDLKLPDGSGLALVRRLHAIDATTRILVFTGFGTIALAVDAMRAGAVHVMTKPADVDELCRVFGFGDGEVGRVPTLDVVADEHVARVLDSVGGNVSQAAKRLGIHRRSLQRLLARRGPR